MTAKVRYVLRYTDAWGQGQEEVFTGRGCFLRAASRRSRLRKHRGAAGAAVVKQVQQPDESWLDTEKSGYEGW